MFNILGHDKNYEVNTKIMGNGSNMQSYPMIYSNDGHSMWFGNMYNGSSAFLILGGPSFGDVLTGHSTVHDTPYVDLLNKAGFVTASVNNSISSFRTDIWISNDNPAQFIKSAWLDPKVMKFSPLDRPDQKIFDSNLWDFVDKVPRDCPNSWFFKRNSRFNSETFMFEDSFNWGNSKKFGGKRSVMLIAIKMLYYLGIKKVFLLGCDFNMTEDNAYHFDQYRHESSLNGNNSTYKALQQRFCELNPIFEALDYKIYNCNKESKLKAFPFLSLDDALTSCIIETNDERTDGLYDREYNLRQQDKKDKS